MSPLTMFAAAADAEGGLVSDIANTFGVNWPLLISQLIAFLVVAFLLKKFAYQPILNVLEDRKKRIAEGMENAEKIKDELAKTEAARKEIMEKANTQANKLIEEARAAAAKVQEQESQKAVAQAEQIVTKAREATLADHERMLAELRREVGQLVVQTTAKVVGKVLTDDDQKRLVEEANKELAA